MWWLKFIGVILLALAVVVIMVNGGIVQTYHDIRRYFKNLKPANDPSPRIIRAAFFAHVVGMLGATEHIKNIFRHTPSNHRRSSAPYPRQSEREKLRRDVGGFAKLHDHTVHFVGEPYVREERRCPICDLGKTHAEVARAA